MDMLEVFKKRRSIRRYKQEEIPEDKITRILQAGLLSPTSRGIYPWELLVVRNKDTLDYLSRCREGGHAKMLQEAGCAIVVVANPEASDVWIEDCSIVMMNMHVMADSLGVGSCWIQGRLRNADGKTTEDYLRERLQFPDNFSLEAILSLGIPATQPKPHDLESLKLEKLHYERY